MNNVYMIGIVEEIILSRANGIITEDEQRFLIACYFRNYFGLTKKELPNIKPNGKGELSGASSR